VMCAFSFTKRVSLYNNLYGCQLDSHAGNKVTQTTPTGPQRRGNSSNSKN